MKTPDVSCSGCGKDGYFGVCLECQHPDHEAEEANHNVRQMTHNRYNPQWP